MRNGARSEHPAHRPCRDRVPSNLLDRHLRVSAWQLDDPAGQDAATVRRIRDEIRGRVATLVSELSPTA